MCVFMKCNRGVCFIFKELQKEKSIVKSADTNGKKRMYVCKIEKLFKTQRLSINLIILCDVILLLCDVI